MQPAATISADQQRGRARRAGTLPAHPGGSSTLRSFVAQQPEFTVLILPGDCFALNEYERLARSLQTLNVSAHLLDYVAAAAGGGSRRGLTHARCVQAVAEQVCHLLAPMSPAARARFVMLGHSRGAYVAIGVLGRGPFDGIAILDAPYLGPEHAGKVPLSVVLPVALQIALGIPPSLSYSTFRRRFFSGDVPEELIVAMHKRSAPLPSGLLRDRCQLDLSSLERARIIVHAYQEDAAHPASRLESALRDVAARNPNLRVEHCAGAHGELLLRPELSAERIVNECRA